MDTTRASLLPPWLVRVLLLASCLSVAQGVGMSAPVSEPGRAAAWVGAAMYIGAFLTVYRYTARALFVAATAGTLLLSFTVSGNTALVAAIATIAVAGLRLSVRDARLISVIVAVGYLAGMKITLGASLQTIISTSAGLLFTYVAVESLRRLRVQQRRTEELLQEVVAGRDDRVRAAALDERARLAREMHDILAHTLSALNIQLESARMLAEQHPDDRALLDRLDRSGRLAREGMEEARRAVGSLRGEVLPGPDLLPGLTQSFERDTGVPAYLDVRGSPRPLASDARLALYRAGQEALTNIRKHAVARSVSLTLCYGENGTELTVEDEGEAIPSGPSDGFGLTGMRERAELLGGRLEAGPTETGFRVSLWIPA
jgi:signal transduction histidine kinase